MAKEEKKELPKHIKKFYDKDDKIRLLIDTTEAVHSEAYSKGLDTIKNEKGQIDYDKLKDIKNQDSMLDKMIDHYINNATKALNLKEKPKDDFEADLLLKKYIGITKDEVRKQMREAKQHYTLKQHENIRDSLIKRQRNELLPLRHSHFEESHYEDILKHVGVKDYVAKDRITQGHAANLLDMYKQKGEISLSDLDELANTSEDKGGWGSKIYFTDKAKEGIKALKDKYKQPKD